MLPAGPEDLGWVVRIGEAAIWDSYEGLLRPHTILRWLDAAYSPPAVRRRWEDHPIFLAWDGDDVVAFADAFIEDSRIVLSALYTEPHHRRRGAGTRLLSRVTELSPNLPVTSDVLLGNRKGERFYEATGFSPGETIHATLFGEPVLERRWWLAPRFAPAQLARS